MINTKPQVRTDAIIKHFGDSVPSVAKYFGVTRTAVYLWGEYIPYMRALEVKADFPQLVEPVPAVVKTDSEAA